MIVFGEVEEIDWNHSVNISLPCFSCPYDGIQELMFVVKWASESCESKLGRVQLIAVFTDTYGRQRLVQGLHYFF